MFFYSVGIYLYTFSIRLASLFDQKAKLWVSGRRGWRDKLKNDLKKIKSDPKIWVHCASLGEFEQGRPIIEGIKSKYPQYKIILSFFSPSGYEIQKNYQLADVVTYLPADTSSNANDFIEYCSPHSVIFIKYEFWLNYLSELHKRKIPVYLASGVIKEHQPFFKWYGKPFVRALSTFKKLFVQDDRSVELLRSLNIQTGIVGGDTRIDRVYHLRKKALDLPILKDFTAGKKSIIAGSTWPKDENIILESFQKLKSKHPEIRLIIAPHEVGANNIQRLCELIKAKLPGTSFSLYLEDPSVAGTDILVINTIGILSSAYQYGNVAYIGGGFDDGIHNILEPATYGLPIAIGPNHKKFNEAAILISTGGASEIVNSEQLFLRFDRYFSDPASLKIASEACVKYIDLNKGASEKVIAELSI